MKQALTGDAFLDLRKMVKRAERRAYNAMRYFRHNARFIGKPGYTSVCVDHPSVHLPRRHNPSAWTGRHWVDCRV